MTIEERRRRRFSDDFRRQQVSLIEAGKTTVAEVGKLYEVKPENVKKWLLRLGSKPLPEKILISNGREYDRIKELERENKRLLELIGKQQVDLVYQKTLVSLAKEKLGEDFEKK